MVYGPPAPGDAAPDAYVPSPVAPPGVVGYDQDFFLRNLVGYNQDKTLGQLRAYVDFVTPPASQDPTRQTARQKYEALRAYEAQRADSASSSGPGALLMLGAVALGIVLLMRRR